MPEHPTFSEDALIRLLNHSRTATAEIAEVRGDYGAAVKEFLDVNAGVNKTGYGMIARLSRMAPEKALDALRTFDAMRDALDAYLGKQDDFFDEKEKDDVLNEMSEDAPDEDEDAGVENFPQAAA